MSTHPIRPRFTPRASAFGLLAVVALGGSFLVPQGHSQAPAGGVPNPALTNMVGKLKAQQAQIAANQAKIEAQTALLKEELRQAKIYSARGGSGRR